MENRHYEDNIEIWENDIQIVSSLVGETMSQYIYYEVKGIQQSSAAYQKFFINMIRLSLIAMGVVLILVIFLSYYIPRSITMPITRISKVTDQVAKADLTVRFEEETGAEAKILSDSLNAMIDKINELLEQVKKEQISLRKAEFELLQAQINPHFLYNTLDTINWMAIDKDEYDISNNITALASILRYGINNSNGVVKIYEEVEWLKQYIFLQQTRLKNTFECKINVESGLMEMPIHKLLLQPFIENAILHGFEGVTRKHILTVELCKRENYIYIEIEDNGCGMAENTVWEINNGIFGNAENKNHIGVENAITRIRMYYGEKANVEIGSELGRGTKVRVWIPLP